MRTRTIDVEINSNSLRILRYKQYDHNNTLEVILRKNKEIVDLTSYAIRVFFTLPNKKVIQRNAVFKDKKIIITIESILLERPGKIPIEITMSNGEEITTIFTMFLEVEESIDRNASIIGNPEWDIIKDGLSVLDDKVSHAELESRLESINIDVPTKTSDLINDNGFISSIPDEFITKDELDKEGYLTEKKSSEIFYSKSEVDERLTNISTGGTIDLSGYAKKEDLNSKVDKVIGKSLVSDAEIERLKKVKNYDDSQIKNEISDIKTSIPMRTSDLINDEGFLTKIPDVYITEEELEDAVKGLDIDTGNCSYIGETTPEDDEKIWFSDGVSSAVDGITYDNPLIQELFACINAMQVQIQKLQEEVEYLKIHGGNGSDTPDIPDVPETTIDLLILEDGSNLLLEDSGYFELETNANLLFDTFLLEDGSNLLLEDGSNLLLEISNSTNINKNNLLLENSENILLENGKNILLESA